MLPNLTEYKQALRNAIGPCMVHYALTYQGKSVPDAVEAAKQLYNAIEGYANACVAEALQSCEPDPELAAAEKELRWMAKQGDGEDDWIAATIAEELDRLRAEVARLKNELAKYKEALGEVQAVDEENHRLRINVTRLKGELADAQDAEASRLKAKP
jgi:hypothetical protein